MDGHWASGCAGPGRAFLAHVELRHHQQRRREERHWLHLENGRCHAARNFGAGSAVCCRCLFRVKSGDGIRP